MSWRSLFGDHVQAHLVSRQPLLIAEVRDEEAELPVEPAPIGCVVTEKLLHGRSPFSWWGVPFFFMQKVLGFWLSLPGM
jgi:hypothetical protein